MNWFVPSDRLRAPPGPMKPREARNLRGTKTVTAFLVELQQTKVSFKILNSKWARVLGQNFVKSIKEAQHLERFDPDKVTFASIEYRLTGSNYSAARVNSDVRTCFKWDNVYLVKSRFTFGQRCVLDGTWHVIQTTQVPLLLFHLPPEKKAARRVEQVLDTFHQHCYKRYVLKPNTRYCVPPRTIYMLVALHKTLFTFDVLKTKVDGHSPFETTEWQIPEPPDPVMPPNNLMPVIPDSPKNSMPAIPDSMQPDSMPAIPDSMQPDSMPAIPDSMQPSNDPSQDFMSLQDFFSDESSQHVPVMREEELMQFKHPWGQQIPMAHAPPIPTEYIYVDTTVLPHHPWRLQYNVLLAAPDRHEGLDQQGEPLDLSKANPFASLDAEMDGYVKTQSYDFMDFEGLLDCEEFNMVC